jgi:hypothetical protein
MLSRMKWKEAANRLNGISIASVGVQWTPKQTDSEVARRVIRYLEDRRVLYNDFAFEEPSHCIDSVLQIRGFLTEEIGRLADGSDLLGPLRVMRAACRKFMDRMQQEGGRHVRLHFGSDAFGFYSALGEFRGGIGPQVALLAVSYKIDVEDDLARTLPLQDRE